MSAKTEALADSTAESGRSSETGELELGGKTSPPSFSNRMSSYFGREIDTKATDWISVYACFLTGFTSAHSFSVRHEAGEAYL